MFSSKDHSDSSAYDVDAQLSFSADGLQVAALTGRSPDSTPGNVGIALSGGGSRAAISAMGQLRALASLGYLSKTKALSSVSGGSWLSVPFTYVAGDMSDAELLGTYVADQSRLSVAAGPHAEDLGTLNGCQAVACMTHLGFSLGGLATVAGDLLAHGAPARQLWNLAVCEQLLGGVGLYARDTSTWLPTAFFAPDQATGDAIVAANPGLASEFFVVHDVDSDATRPFSIVNGTMIVGEGSDASDYLPVQFTPRFSGVVGSTDKTLDGAPVGGGGVQSFAFGGASTQVSGVSVTVRQMAPLSLTDITGVSSAAMGSGLSGLGIDVLDAQYDYFSPDNTEPSTEHADFIDGGGLENTGVASLLAWSDIDSVVACVNSLVAVSVDSVGVLFIDDAIPPLFGFQPYQEGVGYQPYDMSDDPQGAFFAGNQVFEKRDFQGLLNALKGRLQAGEALTALQSLRTVSNDKFGVIGGSMVQLLWLHLSPAEAWPAPQAVKDAAPPTSPTTRPTTRSGPRWRSTTWPTSVAGWSRSAPLSSRRCFPEEGPEGVPEGRPPVSGRRREGPSREVVACLPDRAVAVALSKARKEMFEAWLASTHADAWLCTQALEPSRLEVGALDAEPVWTLAAELLGVSRPEVVAVRDEPLSRTFVQASRWSSDVVEAIEGDFSVSECRQRLELEGAGAALVWVEWDVGDNTMAPRTGGGFAFSLLRVVSWSDGWAVSLPTSRASVALMCGDGDRERIVALVQSSTALVTRHASAWDLSEDPDPTRFEALALLAVGGGRPRVRIGSDGGFEIDASHGRSAVRVRYQRFGLADSLSLVHLEVTAHEGHVEHIKARFAGLLVDGRPRDSAWLERQVRLMRQAQHRRHGSATARAEQILEFQPGHVQASVAVAMATASTRPLDALSAEARAGYAPQLVEGLLHFDKRRYELALPHFLAALAQAPEDHVAHVLAGLALVGTLSGSSVAEAEELAQRVRHHFDVARAHPLAPDRLRVDRRPHSNPRRLDRAMARAESGLRLAAGVPYRGCEPCVAMATVVGNEPGVNVPELAGLVELNPTRGDHQHAFHRCAACGTLYRLHKTYDYDPNGSIDEVRFWRLRPELQRALGGVLDPREKERIRARELAAALVAPDPELQQEAALAAWVLALQGVDFETPLIDATVEALGAKSVQTLIRASQALYCVASRHSGMAARVARSLERPGLPERTGPGRHYARKVAEVCKGA